MKTVENAIAPWDVSDRQPLAARLGEILLIVLVFFAIAGDPAPHVNESHYLCRLKHDWNSNWCVGDLFLESRDAHLVFVWACGWVTKWLSLAATAWVGRVAAWTLLAWAWQRLSWRLVPVPLASVLAAALWVTLTQQAHLAGEWVVGGIEAKCFAYVFVLLALREFVDGRGNRVWLLLGAASAFHAVVGGWSVVICGGIWLAEPRSLKPKVKTQEPESGQSRPVWLSTLDARLLTLRSMLPGLLGGGLLALLGVVPAIALTWHEPSELVAEANRIYVFERLPHHLAILSLPTDEVMPRLMRHSVLLITLFGLTRINRVLSPRGESDNGPRTTDYGHWDVLRRVTWFANGAVLLAVIGLAIELALWNDPPRAAALLRYYWFRLTDFAVPMAVAFLAVRLITMGMAQRRTWATWGLVAAVLLAGWQVTTAVRQRLADPVPPADRKMRDYDGWVDACQWVAENTPPDAVFLTPRLAQSFKWRTGRPEVATYKDVPQDAQSMVEWFHQLHNIYYEEIGGQFEPAKSLGALGTARVAQVARQYGARFVLTEQGAPLEFPVVYWNESYVVYATDPRAGDDAR